MCVAFQGLPLSDKLTLALDWLDGHGAKSLSTWKFLQQVRELHAVCIDGS